jgi:hypothetical protein
MIFFKSICQWANHIGANVIGTVGSKLDKLTNLCVFKCDLTARLFYCAWAPPRFYSQDPTETWTHHPKLALGC